MKTVIPGDNLDTLNQQSGQGEHSMIGWPVCDYSGVIRREVVVIPNSSPSATKGTDARVEGFKEVDVAMYKPFGELDLS